MVSLLWYVFIWWDFVPTSPWRKLHPVPTAMLIVTMISIRANSVRHTVSIGNRFPWLYINCFQSPWFQFIIIESGIFRWWVSERGDEKRKGSWYTLPAYGSVVTQGVSLNSCDLFFSFLVTCIKQLNFWKII